MLITKNNISFNIKGSYSEKWFSHNTFQLWEQNTFHILDYYQKQNGTYIDIGSWIGPTVMYASQLFDRVIAIEPDKLAYKRLVENLSVKTERFLDILFAIYDACYLFYDDGSKINVNIEQIMSETITTVVFE